MTRTTQALCCAVALLGAPRVLHAQTGSIPSLPEPAGAHAARCVIAMAPLEHAPEAATPNEWEHAWAQACPRVGRALGTLLLAERHTTDVAPLRPVLKAAFYLRDGDLFAAAATVASDTAASTVARVASLLVLAHQLLPSDVALDYDQIAEAARESPDDVLVDSTASGTIRRAIPPVTWSHLDDAPPRWRTEVPLPEDAPRRMRQIVDAIPDDPGVPALLRVARLSMNTMRSYWRDSAAPAR